MRKIRRFLVFVAGRHWFVPLALLVGGLGLLGLWKAGQPRYTHWKGRQAAAQARRFLRANDLPKADLALEVALECDPSLEAYSLLGDFYEAAGSRLAVEARRRVSEMRPADQTLRLGLAETALRFNDLETARETLAAMPSAARGTPAYRRAEAACAMLSGDTSAADRFLGEIQKDTPADAGVRLLRDSIVLRAGDSARAETARHELEVLALNPSQRLPALRVLLADAFERRDLVLSGEAGRAMAGAPDASFSDLLDAATALMVAHPGAEPDAGLLSRIHIRAASSPLAAAHYARWLLVQKGDGEAAAWLASQPAAYSANPAVIELNADVAASRRDWEQLERMVKAGAWGPLSSEEADFAFASRVLVQLGKNDLARRLWSETLGDCGASLRSLNILVRLAGIWNWPDGMQDALFSVVRSDPKDEPAAQRLIGLLRSRRESRELLDLLALRRDAAPASDRRRADWAVLSLLVHPAAMPNEATRALEALHSSHPDDPFFATDYALALCQLGQSERACATVDRLALEDRLNPRRAPYLAAVYAAGGRADAALAALARAPLSVNLLPEEAELLASARQKVLPP